MPYTVTDLQACELGLLPRVDDIKVEVVDERDSMGFPRVSVTADSRERLLGYVRTHWGAINRTADDPSVSVSLPVPLAESLIDMVGGFRVAGNPNTARWEFPDGFWTWATDEAVRYALEVLPTVCER